MATFTQIRDAVKTVVEANIGTIKVHPRVPGTATGHALVVQPAPGTDFSMAMNRGIDEWQVNLTVIIPVGDLDVAQRHLDAYVDGGGSDSIRKVIFQNKNLGMSGTSAHVSGIVAYGPTDNADYDNVSATLRMVVTTNPS